jgi:Rrf2 family protein
VTGITNKAEYALLILLDLLLLPPGAVTSTREVAARRGLPPKLVPHLVSLLRSAGWIETSRGPGGGLSLSDRAGAGALSVGQVLRAVGEYPRVKECGACPRVPACPLKDTWTQARSVLDDILSRTRLSDLARRMRQTEQASGSGGERP